MIDDTMKSTSIGETSESKKMKSDSPNSHHRQPIQKLFGITLVLSFIYLHMIPCYFSSIVLLIHF